MSYNGSGTFNINTAGQPVVTGTVISSSTFNSLTADLGTGLSTAISGKKIRTHPGRKLPAVRWADREGKHHPLATPWHPPSVPYRSK